ncbi:hypothetical protein [Alsobacter sp. R-9]
MDGSFTLLKTTLLAGGILCIGGVAAVHHLSGLRLTDYAMLAAQQSPPRQSIEGMRSILDPLTTGSVSGRPVVLDPCTGQRKS